MKNRLREEKKAEKKKGKLDLKGALKTKRTVTRFGLDADEQDMEVLLKAEFEIEQ